MDPVVKEKLSASYFTPSEPVSFSGARNIISKYNHTADSTVIKDWLNAQNAYTLHRPLRKKFPRLHYIVTNIDDVWEADLVEVGSLKAYNNDITYLLVVIDVLSKFAWVETLKNKSATCVLDGFKRILERSNGRRPLALQTDRGKEFTAKIIQKFLKSEAIQYRIARNPDIKAAIVERFNRTLKERMWRYFTYSRTYRFIDVLQQIVDAYNRSKHSSIKMTPAAVTIANANEAWRNIQSRFKERKPRESVFKYKVDDHVRISRSKGVFEKGYEGSWTKEVFRIRKCLLKQELPIYELKDLADENLDGIFYEQELVPVNKNIEEFFIERKLQSRGKGKNREVLVQWEGYPAKFNSWISASSIKDYTRK